jgi:tetratricopeptide (TPR) repeat protein
MVWTAVLAVAFAIDAWSQPLGPPNHEQWQASMNATEDAIARKDTAAIATAVTGVFTQVMRMQDQDSRMNPSGVVVDEALQALEVASREELVKLLEALNELTDRPGGLANAMSFMPAMALTDLLMQERKYAEVRPLMRDLADRAAADLGPANRVARMALRQDAAAAMALGDHAGALASLDEALESARQTYGPTSVEVSDILAAQAQVHSNRDDVVRAKELADAAYAIITAPANSQAPVVNWLELAALYEGIGELARARELYQRGDLTASAAPGMQEASVPALLRIANLNARLGDGAAARSSMTRATEIARAEGAQPSGLYFEALYAQAEIYSMAGRDDLAVQRIEQIEQLAASLSAGQAREARRRNISAYMSAHEFERALRIGEEFLRAAPAGSLEYAGYAAVVALASARKTPSVARTALAEEAVAIVRAQSRSGEPYYQLFALAMSYEAEGRVQESADLQRRIIDEETAKRGPNETSWEQVRVYANTLERLGRDTEAAALRTRVQTETAGLVVAFQDGAEVSNGALVHERSPFGFTVELTDSRWRRWSGEAVGWPLAAFAAQFHPAPGLNDATFVVMPVLLPDGIDRELAIGAFLNYLNHDRGLLKPWRSGALEGYEYRFTRTGVPGRPYDHLGRVLLVEGGFYVVVAAARAQNAVAMEAAQRVLEQVSIDERRDLARLSAAERLLHGGVLNDIALEVAKQGRFDEALALYAVAREFNKSEAVLQNIVLTNFYAGNCDAVRDEIAAYPGGPAGYPPMYIARAACAQRSGEYDAAMSDYAAAFATGLRDDDAAGEYIGLLMDEASPTQAVQFLDQYSAAHESPTTIVLQALVGARVGDRARLDRALAAIEDPKRSSAEAAIVGAMLHNQLGGIDRLTTFVDALSPELVSADLYAVLATMQIEADRLAAARRTIRMGLALAPTNPDLLELEKALQSEEQSL